VNTLRQWVRRVVPISTRQWVAQSLRRWRDVRNGDVYTHQHYENEISSLNLRAEIRQPIMPGALFENKLINLALGAQRVTLSTILPSKNWSFWNYVLQPVQSNGFTVGRNLVNGELTRQVGGGLCQLSSLMYHLALSVGLQIVERHAHSIDIYQENERFTPLGADATVVWGFKDLRINNPHTAKIVFECVVEDYTLIGRVYCSDSLPALAVEFVREQVDAQRVLVNTKVNKQLHTQTLYVQKQGLSLIN
jgi:vancomycin resistance protein VanW